LILEKSSVGKLGESFGPAARIPTMSSHPEQFAQREHKLVNETGWIDSKVS
jgi:hypothetical protein